MLIIKMKNLETEASEAQTGDHPVVYEKPVIRRHAVIMTMAPQGSKMGHGLFPFATRRAGPDPGYASSSPYRRC